MIQIHEHKAGDAAPRWSAADRRLRVESELELALVNGCITHRPRAVRPYEKTYAMDDRHAPGSQVFVAHVHERPAGEIRLSHAWNGYACINQLLVAHHHRRQGVGSALVQHAVAWSQARRRPGVMLETQHNNVAACRLYEACGFQLCGFDAALYQGLSPPVHEVALFWYWRP